MSDDDQKQEAPDQFGNIDAPLTPPPEMASENAPEPSSTTTESTTEAESPTISDFSKSRATHLGFTDSDLEGHTQESLDSMLRAVETAALRMQQPPQQQQQPFQPPAWGQQQQPQQPGPFPPQQQPLQQQPQQPPQQPDDNPFGFNDEYDEKVVSAFNTMHQRLEQMQQALQSAQQDQYTAQLDQFSAWFDGKVSELGDDYHAVYGQGAINSLPPGANEVAMREQAASQFMQLKSLYPFLSDDELATQALTNVAGPVAQNAARQQVASQMRSRQSKTIGRPTGRQTPDPSDHEVDPATGFSRRDSQDLQDEWNRMLSQQGA